MRVLPDKGFTLIELMVTIVVILVLSGTSISAYLTFSKNQTLDTDSKSLVSEINRVRSMSGSLIYPAGCTTLRGYNITSSMVNGVLSGVAVTAKCLPNDIAISTSELLKSSYFSSPIDLTFLAGSGYLSTGDDITVDIKSRNDPTSVKTIYVSTYGSVHL